MSSRILRISLPLLYGLPSRASVVSAFQTPSRWNNGRQSSWNSSQGHEKKWNSLNYTFGVGALTVSSAGIALYIWKRRSETREGMKVLLTLQAAEKKEEMKKEEEKVPIRERRYKEYASVLYKGEVYMTPRDFLESLTLDEPRGIGIQLCRVSISIESYFPLLCLYFFQLITLKRLMIVGYTSCSKVLQGETRPQRIYLETCGMMVNHTFMYIFSIISRTQTRTNYSCVHAC